MASRVLVVDDDPQIVKLFTRLLEEGGYAVAPAGSGTAALQALRDGPVDLVVLDLSMPEPDGFELLKTLRRDWSELPVLVVSGFMQGSLLRAAKLCGASATLSKIEAPRLLVEAVDKVLHR